MRIQRPEISPDQAAMYHIPADEQGTYRVAADMVSDIDGTVTNTDFDQNGILAGTVLHLRRRETGSGKRSITEIIDLDSALLQGPLVGRSIAADIAQIIGDTDSGGLPIPGEQQKLAEGRRALIAWLTLTSADKGHVSETFRSMADTRRRATHPLNREIGAIASRVQDLTDRTGRYNPGAVLAATLPLPAKLEKRRSQLRKTTNTQHLRGHRLENLLVEEGSRTEATIDLLGTLAVAPDRYTFANLTDIARRQRLRVQPLNELAYSLNHAGGHIEDPEVLERVTIGLQLPRYHNYFLYPVRHILEYSLDELRGFSVDQLDNLLTTISARFGLMEELSLSGPYHERQWQILSEAESLQAALRERNFQIAKQLSERIKQRVTLYALPGELAVQTWYGQQLPHTKLNPS